MEAQKPQRRDEQYSGNVYITLLGLIDPSPSISFVAAAVGLATLFTSLRLKACGLAVNGDDSGVI